MKRFFLQIPIARALFSVMLFAALLMSFPNDASSQPAVPRLSLTGSYSGFNPSFYPDGRVWTAPSVDRNTPREFLLPVFITNKWATFETFPDFKAWPIYSFQFTLLYDSTAIQVMGVEVAHPRDFDDSYRNEPLAKHFEFSFNDKPSGRYMKFLNPNHADSGKGHAVTIAGISSKPLPNTSLDADEVKILLYVRFRVVPTLATGVLFAGKTPIIIDNQVIKFGDLNIVKDAPFKDMRKYNPLVESMYPDPSADDYGLLGIDNSSNPAKWTTEPTRRGTIYVSMMDYLPEFAFFIERGTGQIPPIEESTNREVWNIKDPITLDSNNLAVSTGKRTVRVANGVPTTRLQDIYVETDSPWLLVQTQAGFKSPNPIPLPRRAGYINFIDWGILGGQNEDPYGNITQEDRYVYLDIICNPSQLPLNEQGERTGVYVGYITFKSHIATISPVKIRVTFIYFRNPAENENGTSGPRGIELTLRNTKGDRTNIIFGTGHKATNGVDSLYGEYSYEYPLSGFGARWYPKDENGNDLYPYGLGDFAPFDDAQPQYRLSYSRDIRSNTDTTQSIIYYCRFNPDGVTSYPITIEWDISSFPVGSRLYLRDTANGRIFNVDMRKASWSGGTKYSYSIQDPSITSFIIEYTLPRVIEYYDTEGKPIIKNGWNFLSLPVRPVENKWNEVYPNALNEPLKFFQSGFLPTEELHPGIGYFVKYPSDIVDTRFAGAYIFKIANESGDPVRVYRGWNAVGGLTIPVSTQEIQYDFFGNSLPDPVKTRAKGVYAYETNRGYYEVSEIRPGMGYWIWTDTSGYYRLVAPANPRLAPVDNMISEKDALFSQSAKITIRDNAQHYADLYMTNNTTIDQTMFALPPTPPQELFDARFTNNTKLVNSDASVIRLQGVNYPVSINVENADAKYTFIDAVTGEELGTIENGTNGSIVIDQKGSNNIKVIKTNENLTVTGSDVYPNPVVGSSTLRYNVPANENVKVTLFDALGNEAQTLVNEFKTAGEYTATINAANLTSGSYICKIVAGSYSYSVKVTVIK